MEFGKGLTFCHVQSAQTEKAVNIISTFWILNSLNHQHMAKGTDLQKVLI